MGDVYQAAPLLPADRVDVPPGLPPNLPFRIAMFVGREQELARLDAALATAGGVVVHALHGLGGVGKSTLAAHWAAAHADQHTLTWWITADSQADITQGLADLAQALQPALAAVSPGGEAVGLQERAGWAVRWLACHTGWLVVLDNVTHPSHIQELVAAATGGRFLITSRLATGWHHVTSARIRLDVLPPDQALRLLRQIATGDRDHADLDGAAELCAELGYLPLAIDQAAAYLYQTHLSPAAYLRLLAARPAVMYDQAAEGADAQRTIARIWRLTLDRLADRPLAGQLLRVLAWWAPEAIPRSLLEGLADEAELIEALGALAAYNMIILDGDTIAVHRLVQAIARTPDPTDPHRQPTAIHAARDEATRLLQAAQQADPRDPATWPTRRTLLPHIDALIEHAPPDTDTDTTGLLLTYTGLFLNDQGATTRAITYLHRSLITSQRLHGPDHPDTLTSSNALAAAYRAAGNLARAIPLYEQNLTDQERILGPDHPNTLTSRNNLANAYEAAGNLARAIPLYEQNLTDQERILGPDHPNTLIFRNNLAHAYQAVGDLDRAIPLYEQTLTDSERVLGPDHPDTLTSRLNLAGAYQAVGDLDRAIPLYEQTLTDAERVLGPDHPHTLMSRHSLAGAYQAVGDLDRAIPLYEQTLTDAERVLGPDHPYPLTCRNGLAAAYQAAGNLARAIPLLKQTLTDAERVLGPDHPDTLGSRNGLAAAYEAAGNLARAIPLYEQTLTDAERVLGPDHPYTLSSRHSLAYAYRVAGNLARAIPLYEQTLTDAERVLGPDHRDTLTCRNNLAAAYRAAGNPVQAIPLHEQILTDQERVLGPDHPDTLTSRNNLAAAYQAAGNPARAIPLLRQTLTDAERILGTNHPLTRTVRGNLDAARG
ncbi:tetratricopeptide repeat protein [Actinoallomurus rhizosphaericola]|uniref:tetratricopeptide repeat protein n=1 Tax=Actinoallomurus rhizosphaericola TaxID=2952536 RepID=UPI0020938404|nr:tetratricopeptide repeat protein [Actinoallomurus rhizosphaericola]MCO5999688.1 tetratricopeptide repeat protein [Actinoallomurus rhizosphaericola]